MPRRIHSTSRRGFLAAGSALPFALRGWGAGNDRVDVVIAGASTGGVAAALAALRGGATVLLSEETDWVGGQLTSQLVPPDENPWIEHTGATWLYRRYRNAVRAYYRTHYPLTAEARATPYLNPGNGSVSRLAHEPRVSLAVLEAMLQPYLSSGQLTLLLRHKPLRAEVSANRVRSVALRALDTGDVTEVAAEYFLDATDLGELLPLTGTEYITGAEAREETGEPTAPAKAKPENIQAFTVCFAVDYRDGEDHTLEQPADYRLWREYVPKLQPPWPGKLLSLSYSNPVTLEPRTLAFDPTAAAPSGGPLNLWIYRRIRDRRNFTDAAESTDISLVNWPQNDYWLGRIDGDTDAENARHLHAAKQLSLSLLYWLQTEAPRPDGGQGWKGLRLRRDVSGTADGLAKYPYIRESRRIRAEYTVTERQVGLKAREGNPSSSSTMVQAESFFDSVGIGSYRIDLHPSTGGDNYIDISSLPFEIPLGALIPRRVENLLASCKNLGVTHLTNGCYRLHPVEWNIGEAAGYLAAWCVLRKLTPREARNQKGKLEEFQREIARQGVEIHWPQYTAR
ncbi:MAG: FAD-dependent oxidoreductase [Bryobacterales bacterium]|nr:FAD-dependent oxidoreductase [Bryobacterales bacterium]